jgi:hypothetical protein
MLLVGLINLDHEMVPTGWGRALGVSGAVRGIAGYRGATGLLLVGQTDIVLHFCYA